MKKIIVVALLVVMAFIGGMVVMEDLNGLEESRTVTITTLNVESL